MGASREAKQKTREAILACVIDEPRTINQIANCSGFSNTTVKIYLMDLVGQGIIIKTRTPYEYVHYNQIRTKTALAWRLKPTEE